MSIVKDHVELFSLGLVGDFCRICAREEFLPDYKDWEGGSWQCASVVYHSRKRAPFSDSCVSSGRSQAMLCMLST